LRVGGCVYMEIRCVLKERRNVSSVQVNPRR